VGVGVATLGTGGVDWGWSGLAQVLAAWAIAPMIAGACAAVIFMITKYVVLKRKNSLLAGLRMMPIYFAFTTGILTVQTLVVRRLMVDDGSMEWSAGIAFE